MPERRPALCRKRPERIVHDHLRDRDVVRSIVQNRDVDALRAERDAMEDEALDGRQAGAAQRIGRATRQNPGEQRGKQGEGKGCEQPRAAGLAPPARTSGAAGRPSS